MRALGHRVLHESRVLKVRAVDIHVIGIGILGSHTDRCHTRPKARSTQEAGVRSMAVQGAAAT